LQGESVIRRIHVSPKSSDKGIQGVSTLRRVRVIVAVLVLVLALAAFIDFRDLFPNQLKHLVASVQLTHEKAELFVQEQCNLRPRMILLFERQRKRAASFHCAPTSKHAISAIV
jgi:hypothetical protein